MDALILLAIPAVGLAGLVVVGMSFGLSFPVAFVVAIPALFGVAMLYLVLSTLGLVAGMLVLEEKLARADTRLAEHDARGWSPPVAGEPKRAFRLGRDPFARGQHRGVDFAAHGPVRAACAGRVVFAGRVAGEGTVSVRCGRWRVSYAPLARVAVREGGRVGAGARLGRTERGLHLGVRREGERFGYVDPLAFFAARRAPPPVVGPVPKARRPAQPPVGRPPAPAAHPHAAPSPDRGLAPWPVWAGLALGLIGLAGAGRLRLPSRRQEGAPCRASSTSSSSPTIPSSP